MCFFVDIPLGFLKISVFFRRGPFVRGGKFLVFFRRHPPRFFFQFSCVFFSFVFSSSSSSSIYTGIRKQKPDGAEGCVVTRGAVKERSGPQLFCRVPFFFCMDPPLLDYLDFFVLFFSSSSSSMSTGKSI